MAIKLNREGIALNAEERNKRNQNWTALEDAIESVGEGSAETLAKVTAAETKAMEAKNIATAADDKSTNVQNQLSTLVVQGDSSPQATQASVGADGTSYDGNLKARLDAEHNTVTAQLAEKVGGARKAEPEDLSANTLALVTGQGSVNLLTIPQDGSVTPSKLDEAVKKSILQENELNAVKGNNLFNKDKALSNTLLSDTTLGETMSSAGWSTSDFVPIKELSEISIAAPRRVAEYDMFNKYIPGTFRDIPSSADITLTSNAKTRFVRFSILTASINTGQIKYGVGTVRRYPYNKKAVIKQNDGNEVVVDNLSTYRYEVKAGGKNLYNKLIAVGDVRLDVNGTLLNAIGWVTSGFTEVPQSVLTISQVRYIHEYDKYFEPVLDSFVDLTTVVNNHTFTPKANARYIRFTYYATTSPIQVEAGSASSVENYYDSLFADGRKVYDLVDKTTQPVVTDLSAIDYGKTELKQIEVISAFNDSTWSRNTGLTGTIESDLVNTTYTQQSLKASAINGGSCEVNKEVTLDISDKIFAMKIYIEDVTALSSLQMTFFSAADADYFGFYPAVSTLKTGWNLITVPTESFVPKNASTSQNIKKSIKKVYARFTAKAGTTARISFDMFGLTKSAIKKGKVAIHFDDNWDGVWKFAKPAMDKYGFRGNVYVIKDLVGASQFMTFNQLQICYDNGWDLCTHGQVELTTLATPEAIRSELLNNYQYLIDNGFVRSAKHYCTPAGKYNDMSLKEMKRIFLTHRTTKFGYNTLPVSDKHQLLNVSGNNSDITFLKTVLDNTEKNKTFTVMNWHQILESGIAGNEGLASTFTEFIEYLATKNIDVVTMSEVFNPRD